VTLIKVLDGPSAMYLPATGLMLVSGTVEATRDLLYKAPPLDHDEQDTIVTLVHELMHHLQVLSSAYLWRDAAHRADAAAQIFDRGVAGVHRAAAVRLARVERAFRYRAFGVSVVDLCEAAAVLESYKARMARPTADEFVQWREVYFPGKGNSVYRRAFDIFAEESGIEAAFDLLPVVTFLALQGDIPGQVFDDLLSAPRIRSGQLVGKSAQEVIAELGVQLPFTSRPQGIADLPANERHPTLQAVLPDVLERAGGDTLEIFARPHLAARNGIAEMWLPP
jgi:hypothetical protein